MATQANTRCPISGDRVDTGISRTWQDKTICFCSPDCAMEWDDMDDEKKNDIVQLMMIEKS